MCIVYQLVSVLLSACDNLSACQWATDWGLDTCRHDGLAPWVVQLCFHGVVVRLLSFHAYLS